MDNFVLFRDKMVYVDLVFFKVHFEFEINVYT